MNEFMTVPICHVQPFLPRRGHHRGIRPLETRHGRYGPLRYVIHMTVCDRTNFNSKGYRPCVHADIGFCLEEAPGD